MWFIIDIHMQNVFCSHLLSFLLLPLLLSSFLFSTSPSSNFLLYFNFVFLIFHTCKQHIIEIIHRDMCKESFTWVWATYRCLYPEDKASSKEVLVHNDSHSENTTLPANINSQQLLREGGTVWAPSMLRDGICTGCILCS